MIIVPEENDVIHGKGYSVNKRPGNKRYRSLIVSLKADYDAAPKSLKGIYGNQIVNHIYNLSPPGRFLRKDKESGSYFEVDKEVAVRKARQALRDTPKELNKPTRRVASAPLAEQNRNDTFIPRPAAITSPSAIAMSPPPQASIVGSPEDTIRRLLEDNRRLRHQMDRMQKEMEEMVAFNRMLHPRQPQGADNRHDNIVSSSDDGANDESDDLDLDNIDLSFIANDDISIFGMDVEALVNENLSMSEPVLRSKGPSVANKSLIDTSDHNEEVEIKGRGLHKSTDGPFSKFVNAFKKLSCRYSSRRDVAPDLVETENDILKIRIRTMQLMKKLMIQSHNTKLVNQESKAKETGAM